MLAFYADRERTPMLLRRQSWPDIKAAIRGWLRGATRGRREGTRSSIARRFGLTNEEMGAAIVECS